MDVCLGALRHADGELGSAHPLAPHACRVLLSLHFATKAWSFEKTVSTPPHAARFEFRSLGIFPPPAACHTHHPI